MSIEQVNQFGIGNTDFNSMMETLNKSYKGKSDITLSNYDNDLVPVVKAGSVFDNNGAIFIVNESDETPVDYGTISNSTKFYLYYDESEVEFAYSETIPNWDDAKQGWYNANDRALFSMFKDSGGTLYQSKTALQQESFPRNLSLNTLDTDNIALKRKVITGTTVASATLNIAHGLDSAKIGGLSGAIHSASAGFNINGMGVRPTTIELSVSGGAGSTVFVIIDYFE